MSSSLCSFLYSLFISSLYLSFFLTAVAVFRKPNAIPLCFSIDLVLRKFPVVMANCTPSIHVYLGRPLFLLSRGIQSIINFGILSSLLGPDTLLCTLFAKPSAYFSRWI